MGLTVRKTRTALALSCHYFIDTRHLFAYIPRLGDPMKLLLKISGWVDRLSGYIGRGIMWLILAAVLISAGNAMMRKAFQMGSNAFLELQWYLFSAVFLLGAGYAFLKNVHVRIDFLSSRLSGRARSWIDVAGILLFLTPLCWILIQLSWPLFVKAWQSGEMSQNAGGLIRWPVFLLLPTGMALLLLQGASELVKRIAFLRGLIPDPLAHGGDETESPEALPAEPPSAEAR
jgi:TRAP-type mannitol/chloroaromatic compound transport system permease small subunit